LRFRLRLRLFPDRSEESPEDWFESEESLDLVSTAGFSDFVSTTSAAFTAFARVVFFGASVFSVVAETSATTRLLFLTGVVSWIASMFLYFSFLGDICDFQIFSHYLHVLNVQLPR
jgi:hypothetical protein